MDHAGPMKEKTKTSWEHFYTKHLFTISEETRHSKLSLLACTAGIARNSWGATKGNQFTKADTEQTYPIRTSTILTYAMTGTIMHMHTHTHTHTNLRKIRQPERKRADEVERPRNTWCGWPTTQPSMLRWTLCLSDPTFRVSAHYLLLNHFAQARGNVCSALENARASTPPTSVWEDLNHSLWCTLKSLR